MLYDNGLLLKTYSRAYRSYPKSLYKSVVEETVAWLEREMTSPEGGYYSALDADSDGEEGSYYVWNPQTLEEVLGDEAAQVAAAYGITDEGNFERGWSQPALLEADYNVRESLAPARAKLLAAREKRTRPGRDEKKLVAWNAMMISGLAEAAWTFGRKDWLNKATDTLDWIWDTLCTEKEGLLYLNRGAYGSEGFGTAVLDDYATLAEACLDIAAVIDWSKEGQSAIYIERAQQLWTTMNARFRDSEALGFYYTDVEQADVIQRKKEWFDNAVPAGHSCLIHLARDLAQLTGEEGWDTAWRELSAAYPGYTERAPHAISHALTAITEAATGVATIKAKTVPDLEALRTELVARPYRRVFVLTTNANEQPSGYQLCVGTQCLPPSMDPKEITKML